jgi:hypothetical protein
VIGRRFHRVSATVVFAATLSLACSAAEDTAPPAAAVQASVAAGQSSVIDPITPRADFVGPAPARFSWTAIPRATSYAIGIWDDSDVMVWKKSDLVATSVTRPEDVRLAAGHTFFWSVVGIRDGAQIASSGMIAFVVTQ